jgi:C_GCAxxG_C_C family probable redox protein
MPPSADATARFAQGFSCSQSVLTAYAQEFGLDEQTALKIASGFGGGMGGLGHTCGAVTGALMVLGLRHGLTAVDGEAKQAFYARVRQFTERFQQCHGSLACRELLGVDISTAEGRDAAREAGLFQQKCPPLVQGACEILDELQ